MHNTCIEKNYSADIYSEIWEDHQKLIALINQKKKFAVRIKAKKVT